MLRNLLEDKENSSILIIRDTVEQEGRSLFKTFLSQVAERVDCVHVISFDIYHERNYLAGIPFHLHDRFVLHDGASDPLGWEAESKSAKTLTLNTDILKWAQQSVLPPGDKTTAVFIDSLSPLLLHRTAAYTCTVLNRLANMRGVQQVGCLIHEDLHDDTSLGLMGHTASSVFSIEPPRLQDFTALCNTLHKKPSGKIIRIFEHYKVSPGYTITDIEEYHAPIAAAAAEVVEKALDPTADLTFNLSLTDSAKEARSQLHLPFMHHKKRQEVAPSSGCGKIFYQPDEADDFDEEDPDDDLDF